MGPEAENNYLKKKHLWALVGRVFLSVGLLYCIYLVSVRAVGYWHSQQPLPVGLRNAITWDPGNPDYYAQLGRVLQQSDTEIDPNEVVRLFETATRLGPYSARYWADLGGAYEWAGKEEEARRAFERARALFPNSARINWQLGNYYLRDGKTVEALTAFQTVLLGDPSLRQQAFDLAWRATDDAQLILQNMIPTDAGILFQYLNYLCRQQRLDESEQLWAHILVLDFPFEPKATFPYLNALIKGKRVDALVAAWEDLIARQPGLTQRQRADSTLITNGTFESVILNGGLGWRVRPVDGVVVSVDSLTFFDGTHSLRIEFDGNHNVNYHQASHYVPVQPNTSYRFLGYMRTKDITTDMGPHFEIYDAYDARKLFVATESMLGTLSWTPQQLEFRTGPETRLLIIRLSRRPSRKLDNQIAGTLWIDRLSLRALE